MFPFQAFTCKYYNYCNLVSTLELGRHIYFNYGTLLKGKMVISYVWYVYEV
jgi:hypothetical protein